MRIAEGGLNIVKEAINTLTDSFGVSFDDLFTIQEVPVDWERSYLEYLLDQAEKNETVRKNPYCRIIALMDKAGTYIWVPENKEVYKYLFDRVGTTCNEVMSVEEFWTTKRDEYNEGLEETPPRTEFEIKAKDPDDANIAKAFNALNHVFIGDIYYG